MIPDPLGYLLLVVEFYQRSAFSFLGVFHCDFYFKDLAIWGTLFWCSDTWGGCSVDYRHYSFKEILIARGVNDKEVIWYICPDRGGGVVGGGGFYDDIKCWEVSLRYSKMPLWMMACSPLWWQWYRMNCSPLVISRHCRGILRSLFFLSWPIRAYITFHHPGYFFGP